MARFAWLALAGACLAACGGDDGGGGGRDAGGGDPDSGSPLDAPTCATVACDDGIVCTTDVCVEATGTCRHTPPDGDGDGHGDAACVDADGDPIGDDCDDGDARSFPSNPEVCDAHDEDCNPDTLGFRDGDGDGASANACCNGPACGPDCNDDDSTIRPGLADGPPMACDAIDNDCD